MAMLVLTVPLRAKSNITDAKATQWMIGANGSGHILPKRSWKAAKGRNYNIKNLERRRFLQYEKQGTGRGINLGWTANASAATAKKRAQWFFARSSNVQSPITYGERVAIGWGSRGKPFIRYAKRNVGINLNWSKKPVYEWVIRGGKAGQPVRLGKDRVILFNMKHREPLIYFDRPVGANIGWPDSTRWDGPTDEIVDGVKWTAKELAKELDRMVLVCKGGAVCQAKIKAYQGYMIQLRTNVTHYRLPKVYQNLLARHYPNLKNLKSYKFGYASRQPDRNATTDCSRTYYNNKGFVNRLRRAQLSKSEFRWLLHELKHYDQCKRIGGRSRFAKMWFEHLEISALNGNVTDMKKLHDKMPMEKEAENASIAICKKISQCN